MRKHLNPSMIVALVALVFSATGSAVAATVITGKNVKNSTLTGADIKNKSLGEADIKRDTITKAALSNSTEAALGAVDARTRAEVSAPVPANRAAELVVSCPVGTVATGGGGKLTNAEAAGSVVASEPRIDADGTPTGWRVVVRYEAGVSLGEPAPSEATATGYAVCAP